MKALKSIFAIIMIVVVIMGSSQALKADSGSKLCYPNPEVNLFLYKVCIGNLPPQAWYDACCEGMPCTIPCGI
ncbi:MAG: hypothetical protein HYV28_04140 [Ignavibacteriales bacterium]|nr:hypothetical protein [Ignavibacteriales bacterium]